jgi:hypothetical protein
MTLSEYFSQERPDQAFNIQMPAELRKKIPKPYQDVGHLEYPFHDRTALVNKSV